MATQQRGHAVAVLTLAGAQREAEGRAARPRHRELHPGPGRQREHERLSARGPALADQRDVAQPQRVLRVVWVSGAFLPGPDAVGVLLEVDGCGAGAGSPTAAVMALLASALPAALAAVTFTSNVAP